MLMLFVITLPVNSQTSKNQGGGSASIKTATKKDPHIEEAMKLTQGGEYIIGNYKATVPIWRLNSDRAGYVDVDPSKNKATLELFSFGSEGNTVLLTLEMEDGITQTYSWSGHSLLLVPCDDDDYDDDTYHGSIMVMRRGQRTHTGCGGLVKADKGWVAVVYTGSKTYTVSTFKKGMTRLEVENYIKQEFGLSQFKFTRNSGNLKVYSFYWLDQQKVYNFFRTDYHFELRNDKKFADFYFDAQGKLVKWFFFM